MCGTMAIKKNKKTECNYGRSSLAARDASAVYHLLGKTGWSTVVVDGTRQISKGNFHGGVLVPFPRFLPGR